MTDSGPLCATSHPPDHPRWRRSVLEAIDGHRQRDRRVDLVGPVCLVEPPASAPVTCHRGGDVRVQLRVRDGDQLLFGRTGGDAFNCKNLQDRADAAWAEAGLDRITPRECRHTFASLMIAAGVNAKALSTHMGEHLDHPLTDMDI